MKLTEFLIEYDHWVKEKKLSISYVKNAKTLLRSAPQEFTLWNYVISKEKDEQRKQYKRYSAKLIQYLSETYLSGHILTNDIGMPYKSIDSKLVNEYMRVHPEEKYANWIRYFITDLSLEDMDIKDPKEWFYAHGQVPVPRVCLKTIVYFITWALENHPKSEELHNLGSLVSLDQIRTAFENQIKLRLHRK